jgi:hypothetical protein
MRTCLKRIVGAAATVSCLLLGAVPAPAQEVEGEPRVVPGFVFAPSIAMGAIHDDNPVLAANNDTPPSDVVTTVRPAVDLTFLAKHAFLGGGYRGTLQRYGSLEAYDSYDQGGHAEYRQQFSRRISLSVRDSFSLSPTTDLVEVAGVPFTRTGTTQNTFSSGLTVDAAKRLQMDLGYDFQWLHFNRPEEPNSALQEGGTAHTVTIGARRALTSRIKVGGDYRVQFANVGEIQTNESFTIQNAQGIVTLRLSPTVTMEGGAGISRLALPEGNGTHIGPAGHFSLHKRTEYALFTVSTSRSFVPAFGFGGSFSNQEVLGAVRVPFARRRGYVDGSVSWRKSEPVLQRELAITALWVKSTVGYAFQRWLRLEGFYYGAFQDTPIAGGRIDRNRFGVQAVTGYPMRLR